MDGGCAPPQELMTDADLWADMKKPSRRRFYRGLRADTNNMINMTADERTRRIEELQQKVLAHATPKPGRT